MDILLLNPDSGAAIQSLGRLLGEKIFPLFFDEVFIVEAQALDIIPTYLKQYEETVDIVFVNDKQDWIDLATYVDKWAFLIHGGMPRNGITQAIGLNFGGINCPFFPTLRYCPGIYKPKPVEKDIDYLVVSRSVKFSDSELSLLHTLSGRFKVCSCYPVEGTEHIGYLNSRKAVFDLYARSKYVFLPYDEAVCLPVVEAIHCGCVPFVPFYKEAKYNFLGIYAAYCKTLESDPKLPLEKCSIPSFSTMCSDMFLFLRAVFGSGVKIRKNLGTVSYLQKSDNDKTYSNDVFEE